MNSINRSIRSVRQFFQAVAFIVFATATYMHSGYAQESTIRVLPEPKQVTASGNYATLPAKVSVYLDKNLSIDREYATVLLGEIGIEPVFTLQRKQAHLSLVRGKQGGKGAESYRLQVTAHGDKQAIQVAANTGTGAIYALQTLRQLVKSQADGQLTVPVCEIKDEPYFSWRAFMLDESRHFHGKEMVKRLLDEMVRLKFNTFHWHLVDDPAWRIEIKKYPLLTEISSKGDYTHMSKGIDPAKWDSLYQHKPGLFYTQQDIREIVAYAAERGIRIIPEIEVPGHVSASVYAYPWLGASSKKAGKLVPGDLYDVTDPKVTEFLHDVLDEIIGLFPGGIIHIGGDEANYAHWQQSEPINAFMKKEGIPTYADLQVWAINRLSTYISSKGYQMIGWNEITGDNVRSEAHIEASQSEKLAPGTIVQFWDGEVTLINKAIAKGYDVVNSNRFFTYLDYPYETTSLEKAYSFNPIPDGIAPQDRKKILGLGCQLWGEFTPTTARIYYQLFPRLAAFAVIGWVDPDQKPTYEQFIQNFKSIEDVWKEKGYLSDQPYRN